MIVTLTDNKPKLFLTEHETIISLSFEVVEWLTERDIPVRVFKDNQGRDSLHFDRSEDAMLFKLTFIGT